MSNVPSQQPFNVTPVRGKKQNSKFRKGSQAQQRRNTVLGEFSDRLRNGRPFGDLQDPSAMESIIKRRTK